MKKIVLIEKYIDGVVDIWYVREKFQCSERTAYRKISCYKKHWPPWLLHGLKGKISNNKSDKRDRTKKYIIQDRFRGFGPTLLSEKIEEISGHTVPVETLRRKMIQLWYRMHKKHKIVIERRPRQRRSSYGIMQQMDWSYHDRLWTWETRCLIITVDDATWDITEALFTQSERLEDIISFREIYFEKHGKPSSIYLDCHASYKVNHPQDQFDEEAKTRFQRAMNLFWVQVIFAKSPQAKWRVERKFKLLQDRIVKEFMLANIKKYDKAQIYLANILLPQLNKKFHVQPEKPWDFHVPMTNKDKQNFEWYFAKLSERKLNRVGVIRYENKQYQIPIGQELAWTNVVKILESHMGNIQIRSWNILLPYKTLYA